MSQTLYAYAIDVYSFQPHHFGNFKEVLCDEAPVRETNCLYIVEEGRIFERKQIDKKSVGIVNFNHYFNERNPFRQYLVYLLEDNVDLAKKMIQDYIKNDLEDYTRSVDNVIEKLQN